MSCYCCFDQQDSEDEETAVDMTLSPDSVLQEHSSFHPYIPEDFANFENYNATLESQDGFLPSRSELKGNGCRGTSGEREVPRSPTASSCTSGYFSHSTSNATLSDVPFSASESSDHISCISRDPQVPFCCSGTGCTQTKSASAGCDSQQPPLSPGGVQSQRASSSLRIPNCIEKQQILDLSYNCALSASLEFTDFKGADDSIGETELAQFTEEWQEENVEFSVNQQKKTDNVETRHSQHSSDFPGIINKSVPVSTKNPECKYPNISDCVGVVAPSAAAVCTSVTAQAPDKVPAPSPVSLSTVPPSAQTPRAGGEPPIREPAQGDLPHGSPCPSPNPSSAEPSGDSSGDESTPVAQLPDWMAPGEQVWVGKRRGTVHYVGGVEFAKGIWIGVKLDMAVGESL